MTAPPIAPPDETETADAEATPAPAGPALGFLLDETDDAKIVDRINDRWNAWKRFFKWYDPTTLRNEKWRIGEGQVRMVEDPDQDLFYVWTPPGPGSAPPVPNKANNLIERVVATVMVDPPQPDVEPTGDTDEDRADAEFATRMLSVESAESGLNLKSKLEDALDIASHMCSAFLYVCVDPKGGGWLPQEVKAHPKATDAKNPTVDPESGVEGPDFVIKYVSEDGATLQDSPVGAAMRWLPAVKLRVLTPSHVRFWSQHTTGLDDAEGVILLEASSLGDLKARFDSVASLGDDDLAKVAAWRPKGWRKVLPWYMTMAKQVPTNEDGSISDDAICFHFSVYMNGNTAEYPKGAYVVCGGTNLVFYRGPWTATMLDQSPASDTGGAPAPAPAAPGAPPPGREEVLMVPLAQVRQFRDTIRKSPYGDCLARRLGPPEEIRKSILGAGLEYLFRFGNPLQFLPIGSIIQPEALNARDGTPILFNPQGKPETEVVPPFPPSLLTLHELIDKDMDTTSGLEQAAQGLEDASVTSGVQQQTIVEQALIAIGQVKRSSDDCYTRTCRIVLQLGRAFYDEPRLIKYEGEGGSWKEREWSRADLGSTKNVRIARGTSTMLPASAKQQLALGQVQAGVLTADDAARAIQGNVSATIGAQDNPHRNRIKRRIDQWREGPPKAVLAQAAQLQQQLALNPPQPQPVADPATGQPAIDPATGAPALQPPAPPPDPIAQAVAVLFQRLPCDDEQAVAMIHFGELSRAMAGVDMGRFPPAWANGFIMAYQAARQAAGVATVVEQQQAQQQQAAQAQQAEVQKESGKQQHALRLQAADHAAQSAGKQQDAAVSAQRDTNAAAAAAIQGGAPGAMHAA